MPKEDDGWDDEGFTQQQNIGLGSQGWARSLGIITGSRFAALKKKAGKSDEADNSGAGNGLESEGLAAGKF